MKYKMGYKKDPLDTRDFKASVVLNEQVIPKYNERDYSDILTPIKNQGSLGSCVGFAVTAACEFLKQEQILSPTIDLSEMWVYWKAKEIDSYPNEEGTTIRDALKAIQKSGIPLEKYWPYEDERTIENEPVSKPSIFAGMSAGSRKISGYYRINSLQELFDWLDVNGPCIAGIECDERIFEVGADGCVKTPTSTTNIMGGHAICIVEYDKTKNYLGFKNSWGQVWGDKGYGYLDLSYYTDGFMPDVWGIKF